MQKQIFSLLLLVFFSGILFAQGTVRGTVSDENSGEPLMFCNVVLKGSEPIVGVQTDLDGAYDFSLPAGTHTLEVTYVGYSTKTITDVVVKDGEVTIIDFLMSNSSEVLEEVVISATRIDRTENALLALQRKASTIQDGISSQEISRYGASNAAESMKKVTGASVVDGKYIFVRGLGDRYSSAQLNGMTLPSTDPYRNSTSLDIIPAKLLDNLIASKTFTPDQPGNFTGGNVNMQTKSFPERFTVSASVSTSYNDRVSFNDNFLSYDGGKTDWLGYDDGNRQLPEILDNPEIRAELVPSLAIKARRDGDLAQIMDQTSKSINNQMAPTTISGGMNHAVNFAIGNQFSLFNNPLGVLAGVNYRRSYSHYENGLFRNYDTPQKDAVALNNEVDLSDTRSVDNPQIGGLVNLSYKFSGSQKINFNVLYNHDGEKSARYLTGSYPAILSGGEFESRSIGFKERELMSYQLSGEHLLSKNGLKMEWGGSIVNSSQNEPDLRFFANSILYQGTGTEDPKYVLSPSEYDLPYHFFRELDDKQYLGKVDFTIPFLDADNKGNHIKFGFQYQEKNRDFTEDRFQYQVSARQTQDYAGDPVAFFDETNTGIVGYDSTRNQYELGLFLTDETVATNTYSGFEKVTAGYGMVTYDFGKLKAIAGVRMEMTDMEVATIDTTKEIGMIDATDFLPSINLIYRLNENMNLRGSYTHTLARPNMREMAPFSSFEFIGDFIYTGNPGLKRTLVQNYDLRWEMFPNPGELLAVSAYYKRFQDPISTAFLVLNANNNEIQFQNLDDAYVYGAEFELRKSLGFISNALRDFKFTSNFSYIFSEAPIPVEEQEIIEEQNPSKGTTRPFFGQSPFLFNAALNYMNNEIGLDATVSYNLFGARLDALGFGARPDIYERPRPSLDFIVKKSVGERVNIKLTLANLLDPLYKRSLEHEGTEYTITEYHRGRSYGITLSYDL
ncbi:MAG: TonB-dependent receptor [Saprospiraceae bacterium]|nr:TonB-dependent receptor [Saprospiraceae bacterium]